jgi:hypothetical protein
MESFMGRVRAVIGRERLRMGIRSERGTRARFREAETNPSCFSNPHPRRAPDPASIALGVAPTTKTAMQRFMQTGANAVRTAILNRAALPASQVRDSRPGLRGET